MSQKRGVDIFAGTPSRHCLSALRVRVVVTVMMVVMRHFCVGLRVGAEREQGREHNEGNFLHGRNLQWNHSGLMHLTSLLYLNARRYNELTITRT